MSGAVKAIEQGFIQEEIARSAYAYNEAIESGEKIIVGVNTFAGGEKDTTPLFKIDDSIRAVQTEKLQTLRAARDADRATAALAAIKAATTNGNNLMPLVIEAAEAHCTLGEIADVLRAVWGEYQG